MSNDNFFTPSFETEVKQILAGDWEAFMASHHRPIPVSIRLNPGKSHIKINGTPVPWTTQGIYLDERFSFTLDPSFHAGAYYVQEASSMLLEQAFKQHVDLQQTHNILDLCAAPGGKSTHILSLINNPSMLVSNETIRSRANILAENIQKWGHDNVIVTNNDPVDFGRLPGFFDVIVVDAPCSGEGLFRKDQEAMEAWSPDLVALCSSRQKRILSDAWPALKEGGILIYSTCTYNTAENEDNLVWLKKNKGVEFLPVKVDPSWGFKETQQNGITGYRAYPHRVKGEGFFLAVMRKCETANQERAKKMDKKNWPLLPKKTTMRIHDWVTRPDEKVFIQENEFIRFFPTQAMNAFETVQQKLRVVTAGTTVAAAKHDKLIPDHAMAMSSELKQSAFNRIALSKQEGIRYLRKDSLVLSLQNTGFSLVTYNGLALGWVNVLSNRVNNLYPSGWRIRMEVDPAMLG